MRPVVVVVHCQTSDAKVTTVATLVMAYGPLYGGAAASAVLARFRGNRNDGYGL